MRRRAFIRGIAAFAASPCAARAQQRSRKIPQIGWLAVGSPTAQTLLDEYCSGMRPAGAAGAPPTDPRGSTVDNSPVAKSAAVIASLFSPCYLLLEKLSKSLIPSWFSSANMPRFKYN